MNLRECRVTHNNDTPRGRDGRNAVGCRDPGHRTVDREREYGRKFGRRYLRKRRELTSLILAAISVFAGALRVFFTGRVGTGDLMFLHGFLMLTFVVISAFILFFLTNRSSKGIRRSERQYHCTIDALCDGIPVRRGRDPRSGERAGGLGTPLPALRDPADRLYRGRAGAARRQQNGDAAVLEKTAVGFAVFIDRIDRGRVEAEKIEALLRSGTGTTGAIPPPSAREPEAGGAGPAKQLFPFTAIEGQ